MNWTPRNQKKMYFYSVLNLELFQYLIEVASTLKSVNKGASPGIFLHIAAKSDPGLDWQVKAEIKF